MAKMVTFIRGRSCLLCIISLKYIFNNLKSDFEMGRWGDWATLRKRAKGRLGDFAIERLCDGATLRWGDWATGRLCERATLRRCDFAMGRLSDWAIG